LIATEVRDPPPNKNEKLPQGALSHWAITCYCSPRRATERRSKKPGADSSRGLGFKAWPHPKVQIGMDTKWSNSTSKNKQNKICLYGKPNN